MVVLSVVSTFFGTHWFVGWYWPGLAIAICLVVPKRYSMRVSVMLLALALIFALWPRDAGPFGPALSDAWLISIALSPEAEEWGVGQIVNFWALLCEKVLSLIAGVVLVEGRARQVESEWYCFNCLRALSDSEVDDCRSRGHHVGFRMKEE